MEIHQSPYIILSLYQPLNPQGPKLGKRNQKIKNSLIFVSLRKKTKTMDSNQKSLQSCRYTHRSTCDYLYMYNVLFLRLMEILVICFKSQNMATYKRKKTNHHIYFFKVLNNSIPLS